MSKEFFREDAAASIYWTKSKTEIDRKLYEKRFADLIGRTLVPAKTDISPAASKLEYEMITRVGAAKLVAAYGDDAPRVDIYSESDTVELRRLAAAFAYHYDEIMSMQLLGISIPAVKGMAARKAIEEKIDDMIALGSSSDGIYGLLNNPNVTPSNVANPGSGTPWSVKTAAEMLEDMLEPVRTTLSTTFGREKPDTMLLPPDQYARASTTPMFTGIETTVLDFFLKKNGHINTVIPWHKCDGAGAGATDRLVTYRRDSETVEHALAEDFVSLPAQFSNFEAVVNCTAKHGGVIVRYPMVFQYRDGI